MQSLTFMFYKVEDFMAGYQIKLIIEAVEKNTLFAYVVL